MGTEQEAREAQKALDGAVEAFIEKSGWNHGLVLTGWVLVASQAGFDEDGESTNGYPLVYSGGSLPDHTALGLLQVGQDIVRQTGRYQRTEEGGSEED